MAKFEQVRQVKDRIKEKYINMPWWRGVAIEFDDKEGFFVSVRVSSISEDIEFSDEKVLIKVVVSPQAVAMGETECS
jgi:hypothetical protein